MPEIFSPAQTATPNRAMSAESSAPSRNRDGAARATGDFAATLQEQIRQRRESDRATNEPRAQDKAAPAGTPSSPEPANTTVQSRSEVPVKDAPKKPARHESAAPGADPAKSCAGQAKAPMLDESVEAGASAASNADPGTDLPAQFAAAAQAVTLPVDAKTVGTSNEADSKEDQSAEGTEPAGSATGAAVGAAPAIPAIPAVTAAAPAVIAEATERAGPKVSVAPSVSNPSPDPATDGQDAQRADPSDKHRAPPQLRAEAPPRFAPPGPGQDGARDPAAHSTTDAEAHPLVANQGALVAMPRSAPTAALQPPAAAALVSTPADHPGFADEVGQKVVLFAGRGESKAELVLTPPHLGRVEVTLTVGAEQTTAQFVAATTAARDALEQALPRLREMFAQAGIELGQSSVGTQSERGGQDGQRGNGHRTAGFAQAAEGVGQARWVRRGDGLIDTFA